MSDRRCMHTTHYEAAKWDDVAGMAVLVLPHVYLLPPYLLSLAYGVGLLVTTCPSGQCANRHSVAIALKCIRSLGYERSLVRHNNLLVPSPQVVSAV